MKPIREARPLGGLQGVQHQRLLLVMSPQDPLSPPPPNTRPAYRVSLLACLKPGGVAGVPVEWICLRRPQHWGCPLQTTPTFCWLVWMLQWPHSVMLNAHPELNPGGKEPCSHMPDPLPCLHEPGRQHPEGSACGGLVDTRQKKHREIEPPENVIKIKLVVYAK